MEELCCALVLWTAWAGTPAQLCEATGGTWTSPGNHKGRMGQGWKSQGKDLPQRCLGANPNEST